MDKIVCIAGPTATGKTALAAKLAHAFEGELINADSRQMYRGLRIISGQDRDSDSVYVPRLDVSYQHTPYTLGTYTVDGIPVWMYDVADTNDVVTAAHFVALADRVISDIRSRGKLPIVVGGNGFYLSALLSGADTLDIPPDAALRRELSTLSVESLQEKLKHKDPDRFARMNESDRANSRRLIRAIEVATVSASNNSAEPRRSRYDACVVALAPDTRALEGIIRERVIQRMDNGALDEVRLFGSVASDIPASTAIGVPILSGYIKGTYSRTQAIDMWTQKEVQYVKRQMTWFRAQPDIHWFASGEPALAESVTALVRAWYT